MKLYLPFNNPANNLQADIVRTIKEYYPIDVKPGTAEYDNHPACQNFSAAINDQMGDYNAYIKPWKHFLKNLPKGFKSKIQNESYPMSPSYGGKLVLDRYVDDSMLRHKELVFNVSWMGNFYTIFGIDETVIRDEGMGYGYSAINVITISPYREFESGFTYLQNAIENHFKDYKFVPFLTCSAYLKEVETSYFFGREATVYNSLFSHRFDTYHLPSIHRRGDIWYRSEPSKIKISFRPPPKNL